MEGVQKSRVGVRVYWISFKDRENTMIGSKGVYLSGGEKTAHRNCKGPF